MCRCHSAGASITRLMHMIVGATRHNLLFPAPLAHDKTAWPSVRRRLLTDSGRHPPLRRRS
jgi:hypothetical protein